MVEIFKSLGEETRLRIMAILINREVCACIIEKALNLKQSNASRHLSSLKRAGIIASRKTAQWAYYRISEDFINNNTNLYEYLVNNLQAIQSYDNDNTEYERVNNEQLCD